MCARVKYSVPITGSVVAIIGTSTGEAAETPNTAQRGPASAGPAAGPLVSYPIVVVVAGRVVVLEVSSKLPLRMYDALQHRDDRGKMRRTSHGQVWQKAWGSIGAGDAYTRVQSITLACICLAHTPAQRLLLRDSKPLRQSHNRSFFRLSGAPRASLDLRFAFDSPPADCAVCRCCSRCAGAVCAVEAVG